MPRSRPTTVPAPRQIVFDAYKRVLRRWVIDISAHAKGAPRPAEYRMSDYDFIAGEDFTDEEYEAYEKLEQQESGSAADVYSEVLTSLARTETKNLYHRKPHYLGVE